MLPVVVVHGGSGVVPNERVEGSALGVCSAARAGYTVLQGGGSSMDAVVEAVILLENNPFFNAGKQKTLDTWYRYTVRTSRTVYTKLGSWVYFFNCAPGCGSVLNVKGEVEMDALVMDGRTLASGAVSAVRNIANPIQLARLVMDKVWTCGNV